MRHIKKCESCKEYTLKDICPKCQKNTIFSVPPKFSPLDKYAKYRRMATLEERKKEELI